MDIKTYDDVTVKKEKDSVIFIDAEHCFPMKYSTFRQIVCANVKEVMQGEPEQTISQILDNGTPWEEV